MTRVLIITYYWPPSGGSGVQRWLKFVKYLPQFGFEPIVITVAENYASYPLTDFTLAEEISDGVRVIRTKSREPFGAYKKITGKKSLPHSGFAGEKKSGFKDSVFKFIRGNFFIPDPRKGWNRYAYRAAEKIICEEGIRYVVTTSPPHSTQLIGLKLKKALGIKWIADLRDPWTDIYYYKELKHTVFAKRKDIRYERQVLESADSILVVSNSIRKLFAAKSAAINEAGIHVIPNGYDEADFVNQPVPEQKNESWTISYIGNLADTYRVGAFIRAFAKLIKHQVHTAIRFVLVGNLPASVVAAIKAERIEDNFEYISYVPHKEAVQFLKNADALFLAIPDVPNNEGILTGKLFEYLAVRKPIVCLGPKDGDAAGIIETTGAGAVFGYTEETEIFNYLNSLVENWKSGSGDYSKAESKAEQYSRRALTGRLAEILKSI